MASSLPVSNPMAPPSNFKAPKTPGLSNADFRVMLMTPRRSQDAEGSQYEHLRPRNQMAPPTTPKPKPKQKKKSSGKKWKPKEQKEKKESKYRDRAAERREGVTEYGDLGKDAIEKLKEISVEESKYLGGDIEHTHLVKGLDYALLEKARSEIAEEQKKKKQLEKTKQEKESSIQSETVTFKTHFGRNIYHELFERRENSGTKLFMEGRTAFVFDLERDSAIPTTLIRSAQPKKAKRMVSKLPTELLTELDNIMSYVRSGNKVGKRKMSVVGASAGDHKVSDDEDIFPETGSYQIQQEESDMEIDQEVSTRPAKVVENGGGEDDFDKLVSLTEAEAAAIETKMEAEVANMQSKVTSKRRREGETDLREKDPTFVDNDYAECYPGAYEASFSEVIDHDSEEEDLTKMEIDRRKRLRRWDFDTEEEWAKYNETREALPRAAFQFGVKMSDGRKSKRQKEREREKQDKKSEKRREQKLNNKLHQVTQIMKKYSKGEKAPVH